MLLSGAELSQWHHEMENATLPVDVRHQFPIVGRIHFLIVGSHPGLDGKSRTSRFFSQKPVEKTGWVMRVEIPTAIFFFLK